MLETDRPVLLYNHEFKQMQPIDFFRNVAKYGCKIVYVQPPSYCSMTFSIVYMNHNWENVMCRNNCCNRKVMPYV